jgi:hypothetical protein
MKSADQIGSAAPGATRERRHVEKRDGKRRINRPAREPR